MLIFILFLVPFASNNNNNASSSSYQPKISTNESFENTTNKKIKTEVKKESKIDDEPLATIVEGQLASSTLRPISIEDEIAKLEAMLPPIDYEAAARDIFSELETLDEHGDVVECTCTFREVITYSDEIEEDKVTSANVVGGVGSDSNNIDSVKVKVNGDNIKHNSDMSDEDEDDDDDETDDFCAVEDIVERSPPPVRSAVKSIFDPEYDANENLIEEMVRNRKLLRETPKVIEVKIEKDAVKSSRIESLMNNIVPETVVNAQQTQVERVPIINYVCDEDPMCPARAHFQRDHVKRLDVERLHQTFISGVNGFFNGTLENAETHDYSKDSDNIDYTKHQLWKRVVPRYNFLTLDKVPKSFDDDSPYSMPPPPPPPEIKIKEEKDADNESLSLNGNRFEMHDNRDIEFREWHQSMNVRSYKDEILTILPYVVID